VINWLEQRPVPLSDTLNTASRLNVTQGDVYQQLAGPPKQRHGLLLIDVDHLPDENLGAANGEFYTAVGLQRAKLHHEEDGLLGVWSYAESSRFVDALHEVFREVCIEPVTVFNNLINVQQTDWLFLHMTGRRASH
jgi:23S rRNA A2030 N6-methylase RlmJ